MRGADGTLPGDARARFTALRLSFPLALAIECNWNRYESPDSRLRCA
jgi:hypothetical protein